MRTKKQLESLDQIHSLPVQYEHRTWTDVFCILIGILFSLIMIILALVLFNYKNYFQVNFPADSSGILCGIDKPAYPYIYFVNPPDMARRVCVKQCPTSSGQSLQCIPTDDAGCAFSQSQGFQVKYYQNEAVQTRSGAFCFPKDQSLKKQLQQNSKLEDRDQFYKSLDTIYLCFFVAIGISFIYFLLVQFLPKIMNYAAVIVGGIIVLVTAVLLFLYKTHQTTLKIIAGVILLLFLLVIIMTILKNNDSWRMHAIFLKYSTKMIKQRKRTLLYLPIFFLILFAFCILVVLEFWGYWSHGHVTFDHKKSLFHELEGVFPVVLSVFLIIQTIWGLTFIKQAFNFCVSGQAVDWYYNHGKNFCYPFKLLTCKHLGSVIAGSFITGVFSIPDFIFDLIKPDFNANPNGAYTKCYNSTCKCCYMVFDLVRSDAMAFIYLTGNPFCNSARYCQYLCGRSVIMDYSQSTSRTYRICSHLLIMGIMAIFALYVKGIISIYALLIIMIQTLFISDLFISVHADATQAIQIVFLTDQEFNKRTKNPNQNNQYFLQNFQGNYQRSLMEEVKAERLKQMQKRRGRGGKSSISEYE